MKKLTIFVLGSVIGYLLWISYFALIPPKLLVAAVAHEYSQKAIVVLGNHMARESAVQVAYIVIRALPAALALGTLVGGVLHFFGKRFLLCMSVLTWPLFIVGRYLVAFREFGYTDGLFPVYFKGAMLSALAIYSIFFLVVLISYTLGKLVTHNSSLNSDAPTSGAPVS